MYKRVFFNAEKDTCIRLKTSLYRKQHKILVLFCVQSLAKPKLKIKSHVFVFFLT